MRTEAGRDPHDKELQNLVGELSTRSEEFRRRWGAHNVRHHGTGAKSFHHPIVGDLTLAYEGLELAADPGLTRTIYTAEPGSPSEEALRLLTSWAASQDADPTPRHSLRNNATCNPASRTAASLVELATGPGCGG